MNKVSVLGAFCYDTFMVILFISALLLVNGYHLYLVLNLTTKMKANSVSESALYSTKTLIAYKIIHSICAAVFIAYAIHVATLDNTYLIASILLACAGLLDITQSIFLTKKTSHAQGKVSDPHQLSAWPMSISYVLSCIVFLFKIGLWYQLALPIIMLLTITALWLKITRSKHYYVGQMIFFSAVSIGLGVTVLMI